MLLENDKKTTGFGQHWPSSGFVIRKNCMLQSVYIQHAAAYRYRDLIIEDFELNMAYSLGVEPSGVGSEHLSDEKTDDGQCWPKHAVFIIF